MSERNGLGQYIGGSVTVGEMKDAVDQVADISQLRGRIHDDANLFTSHLVAPEQSRGHELRPELARARGLVARWAIMAEHLEFNTVDLEQIDNEGSWDATDAAEAALARLQGRLRAEGKSSGAIDRTSPEAKRRITIDPTILGIESLVVVRRKRLVMATQQEQQRFAGLNRQGKSTEMQAATHMEVDKVSQFVLDAGILGAFSTQAGRQLRRIQAAGRPVEVTAQENGRLLSGVLEAAITERGRMLVPAVTTYYGDRKFKEVHQAIAEAV